MYSGTLPAEWLSLVADRTADQDTTAAVAGVLWSFLNRKDWRKDGETTRQTTRKSLSYQELARHFPKENGAAALDRSGLFTVGSEWKKGIHTRFFELTGQGWQALRDYIDTATQLPIYQAPPEPHRAPDPISYGKVTPATQRAHQSQPRTINGTFGSRDINGNRTRALHPINHRVPVNIERLIELVLDCTAELEHRVIARQLLEYIDDNGTIEQRYTEHQYGRLFVHGAVNLQNAPAVVRNAAMSGFYDFDFKNCYPTIYHQKAEQLNISTPMLNYYISHRDELLQELAKHIKGSDRKQIKSAILALQHFAGVSGVIEATGKKGEPFTEAQANRFISHPKIKRLRDEFKSIGNAWIAEAAARPGRELVNAIGKGIDRTALARKQIAHLLQGVEALAMQECRKHYAEQIVLLMHDGFVSTGKVKTAWLERKIEQATGFHLRLECTPIDPENHPSKTGVKRKSQKDLRARLHAVCRAFDPENKTVKGLVCPVGFGLVGLGCGFDVSCGCLSCAERVVEKKSCKPVKKEIPSERD